MRKLRASFPYRKDMDYSKLITKKTSNEVDTALDSEPEDIESDDDEVINLMTKNLQSSDLSVLDFIFASFRIYKKYKISSKSLKIDAAIFF